MKTTRFFPLCLVMCLFMVIVFGSPSFFPQTPVDKRQNLLLITIDTLRADRLGCYGGRNPGTPNIDRFAERGILFSRAFANTSTTLPSHANILLGTTPIFHGIHENLNFIVNRDLLTLAEHLKEHGYSTGAFVGAYPLDSRFGLAQGFDVYDDDYSRVHAVSLPTLERKAEAVVESALHWLGERTAPWFLWIHCWDPHTPYDPPEPFKTQHKVSPYEGEVAYVDHVLGGLFDFMREKELFDSTLLILTGDHGESLGQHGEETHGYFAYNSSIWIPLLILSPQSAPGRVDDFVSHIDIFPTVCELLGIEKPSFLQGSSLVPALRGKKFPQRQIYFESLYPFYSRGWAPLKGFIHQEKKYIDSPIPELYDLNSDFDELRNLAERENTDRFAAQLENLIRELTPAVRIVAGQQADRETREKLASLGYVSGGSIPPGKNKEFQVEDDVKVMLSYSNRIDEGWNLYKNGEREAGIRIFETIIEERKDIDTAYTRLASIHQETGDSGEALAVLEQGLGALPESYEIYIEYMELLLSVEQYDRVIQSFEQVSLREAEYDPEIWNNLGTAYAGKGDFETAIRAFEMGLSLDGDHPELFNNLANASYSQSLKTKDPFLFTRSFEYYKKSIELDPGYAAPYFGLGHAYREEGNLGGAIFCWQKALELDPGFREAHFDLAIAYLKTGDKDHALVLFNEYKKLYSEFLSPEEVQNLDILIVECKK